MFKGTPRHPKIPDELTSHGSRPNGTTNDDRTNYFETFAATDANLEWALDLESDRMQHSFVAQKDLDSEMTVVRNEYERGENDPENVLSERIAETAFLWHHYGNPTIGARSDIENVPIDRLQAFYRLYYQPDNAVLVVAGKIDEAKVLAKVVDHFGPLPRPTRILPRIYTQEPVQDGERTVTLRRVGDTQFVMAAYHVVAGSHPDIAALDILSQTLGDTPSGRLYAALVAKKRATMVGSWLDHDHDPGLLWVFAQLPKDKSADDVLETVDEVTEKAVKKPPTAEEVERARVRILKNWELNRRNTESTALQLSQWSAQGDWRLLFLYRDRVKAVKVEDVARVAAEFLKSSNRTSGVFIPTPKPDRADVPATPDLTAQVKDYRGGAAIADGEQFDPSPSNVDARTQRSALPGGMKLALLPKKTRGAVVHASLTLRIGNEKALLGKAEVAHLAGNLLMRGTKEHTRQQLRDAMDKIEARIGVGASATSVSASIEVPREHLAEAMKLAAEMLRDSTFPGDELEVARREVISSLEDSKSDPASKARIATYRQVYPYPRDDVRYVATPDESIADATKATREQIVQFAHDFYGASTSELAVVGDFDPAEVTALARELFDGWKAPTPFERLVSQYRDIPPLVTTIEAPDKTNATLVGSLRFPMREDDPDYPALVLGNFMTGGGFLNSRLAARIRQKEGISYGVGSGINVSSLDVDATFNVNAIYAPQNDARLMTALHEELDRVTQQGFTADEVAAAKTGWLQSRQVSRAHDAELAGSQTTHLYLDRTYAWDADLEKRVGALTPAQIGEAMKKHLDVAKLTIVRSGDFAGAKAKAGPAVDVKAAH